MTLHKLLNNHMPAYLVNQIRYGHNVHHYASRNNNNVYISKPRFNKTTTYLLTN